MTTMTEDHFWSLIELVTLIDARYDLGAHAVDGDLQSFEIAVGALSTDEKIAFFRVFSQKLHALDTPTYYDHCRVGGDEASSDIFLYARCHLLSLGREVYEKVLSNPASFPADLWFEDVLSIVIGAYDEVYEQDPDPDATPSFASFTNDAWQSS